MSYYNVSQQQQNQPGTKKKNFQISKIMTEKEKTLIYKQNYESINLSKPSSKQTNRSSTNNSPVKISANLQGKQQQQPSMFSVYKNGQFTQNFLTQSEGKIQKDSQLTQQQKDYADQYLLQQNSYSASLKQKPNNNKNLFFDDQDELDLKQKSLQLQQKKKEIDKPTLVGGGGGIATTVASIVQQSQDKKNNNQFKQISDQILSNNVFTNNNFSTTTKQQTQDIVKSTVTTTTTNNNNKIENLRQNDNIFSSQYSKPQDNKIQSTSSNNNFTTTTTSTNATATPYLTKQSSVQQSSENKYQQSFSSSTTSTYSQQQNQQQQQSKQIKDTNYGLSLNYSDSQQSTKKEVGGGEGYGIVGLKNIGNTCFMNSILQGLFNTPQLGDYFLMRKYEKELSSKNKGVAEAYASLLKKIREGRKYSSEYTNDLKSAVSKISKQFYGYDQQDAQEFLRTILDGLHEDLNRVKMKPKYTELKADESLDLQKTSDEWFNYNKKFDDSIIIDFFCGQLLSRIICQTCNNKSLAFDNFLDLSLPFTKGLQKLEEFTIERVIESFLQPEQLDDSYYCAKCKQHRKSTKKFSFWKLPKILVFHLKRFSFGTFRKEKLNKRIIFPIQNLNMQKFVDQSNDPTIKDAVYNLYAIINHSGSLNGGHYTSECMNPYNKQFYSFNDSHVSEVNLNKFEYETEGSSSPYLLFYCKQSLFNQTEQFIPKF